MIEKLIDEIYWDELGDHLDSLYPNNKSQVIFPYEAGSVDVTYVTEALVARSLDSAIRQFSIFRPQEHFTKDELLEILKPQLDLVKEELLFYIQKLYSYSSLMKTDTAKYEKITHFFTELHRMQNLERIYRVVLFLYKNYRDWGAPGAYMLSNKDLDSILLNSRQILYK